jgi:GxxExxY protein
VNEMENTEQQAIDEITRSIIGCAMKVHGKLGAGFLETVYQNAMKIELHRAGHRVECERSIKVLYEDIVVGDYNADMVIDDMVIVENKAVTKLLVAHEIQLVNYLTATGIEAGLLLNFGSDRLVFRRKNRTYRPPGTYAQEESPITFE